MATRDGLPPMRSFICSNWRSEIPTRKCCQRRRNCKSKNAATITDRSYPVRGHDYSGRIDRAAVVALAAAAMAAADTLAVAAADFRRAAQVAHCKTRRNSAYRDVVLAA